MQVFLYFLTLDIEYNREEHIENVHCTLYIVQYVCGKRAPLLYINYPEARRETLCPTVDENGRIY